MNNTPGSDAELHNVYDVILGYKNSLSARADEVMEASQMANHRRVNIQISRKRIRVENQVVPPALARAGR